MDVSVVIPVYNAEKYLSECVASVLAQPEVNEVLLIDDASKDNSLELCHQLAKDDRRIKVFTHGNNENKGPGETRNVGIIHAQSTYVAFIDADDVFLPGRFHETAKLFAQHSDAEGVYEAVGNFFTENAVSLSQSVTFDNVPEIHMVHKTVSPQALLGQLIDEPTGIIMLQGLCVKRSIFKRCGLFHAKFRVFEDMLLIKKMAAIAHLYPGSLTTPVSLRRIHDSNISFSTYKDINPHAFMEGEELYVWAAKHKLETKPMNAVIRFYYRQYLYRNKKHFHDTGARLSWCNEAIRLFPKVVRYQEFWKIAPVAGRFIK
ncbi:MAG: glycosyltransferase family 2 protein [Chitinophagales bacterium]|nr:glycosyltransferase family 2 protein [Chitinophagales bacterium]